MATSRLTLPWFHVHLSLCEVLHRPIETTGLYRHVELLRAPIPMDFDS